MKSRTLVFAVLLCALFLFVSSTVAAEKTPDEEVKKEDEAKQPDQFGGRCRYGCCGRGLYGQCRRCCRTEQEASETSVDINGYGGGGWGGGGQGGGWGGGGGGGGRGGGGWGGGGRGGGGYGGHCRYGCCGGYGRYCRCCYNAEEAQAVQVEN